MKTEATCGQCKYFVPNSIQPPDILIDEEGREGTCTYLGIDLTNTYENWTMEQAILDNYPPFQVPGFIELGGICYTPRIVKKAEEINLVWA